MTLGIILKSLTSSRKYILTIYGVLILNRYTSYNGIEELETELTYSSINQSGVCTLGVFLLLKLLTGVELDKFVRFVEISNGKSILYHTVEILNQNEKVLKSRIFNIYRLRPFKIHMEQNLI